MEIKDALDKIQHHAQSIRQDIGHIRNGANVTPEELWSANESLDELFKVLVKAKELIQPEQIPVQRLTGVDIHPREFKCKEMKKPGGCQLHNLHCGWPGCNR